MDTIQGYQIIDTLYQSSKSLVYRGRRNSDNTPVILKILQPDNPSPEAIARFRNEYEIANTLHLEGTVKVYSLEPYAHSLVLAMEDFGGKSLDRCWRERPISLAEFLELAIHLAAILGEVHQHHVIHKDINPANLVLNPATGQVKLIDFGISTVLSRENSTFLNPNVIEGTLAYLSPEQTGRMNRAIDYRTDFYSLGVTFYRLLCDRLPFETNDAIELVHCHMAKQPIPPHELNSQIPSVVSDLVMKLLAKNAEERYQSAEGIQADLQVCLNQFRAEGEIASFLLAQQDISDRFQLPRKLYGRIQEVEALLTAVERAEERSELVLVSGPAGAGKSSLTQEIYYPITSRNGYFIAGKFERLQADTPYTALIQAFQSFIRQLLAESETEIATWRKRILTALGANAQVMIEVIPEMEWIVGKQPAVPELPPAEANHRFNLAFQAFIRVFARPQHPLAIFLDDLQWADGASLKLVQQLTIAGPQSHLLLIGAYREVDAEHPINAILAEIRRAGARVTEINLLPLEVADIVSLVSDMLNCDRTLAQPLAELAHQKTQGNPHFVGEFLKELYRTNLLSFNGQHRVWQWDLRRIQATQLTDDFIQLIADKIRHLSTAAQEALALASCIGNSFDSKTLSLLRETTQVDMARELWEAVQADLIEPMTDAYKYWHGDRQTAPYRFLHDRIQQVAYSLLPETDKPQTHLRIGQLLLEQTPSECLEEQIFEIVNHLNLGSGVLTHQAHKDELARLNLIAGNKAKASVAYESALAYFTKGLALLDQENVWDRDYELTLKLHGATAEAAYLNGQFEQMERLIGVVLTQAKTVLDRVRVYEIEIQARIAQNKSADAIAIALQALVELGVRLPSQPKPRDIWFGTLKTKLALAGKRVRDLLHLPPMQDPEKRAAMQLISSVCTPTYFTKCNLWQMMVFQKVQLSLKYGNAPGSAFGFADYGMVLGGVEGNFEGAYEFSQLASELQPQLNAKFFVPKTLLLINIYLRHWHEHLRNTLTPLVEAYQTGLETGDLEYGTFAIAFHAYHSYLVGRELSQIEPEMSAYGEEIAQFKLAVPLYVNQIYRQVVLNLMGRSEDPCCLVGESYNEDEQLPQLIATKDLYGQFQISLNKLILYYLFGNYPQAATQAVLAEQFVKAGATGMLVVPVLSFYNALAHLAVYPNAANPEQQHILKTVAQVQTQMKLWADTAPMNYLHKYHLIEAERCRILGQTAPAAKHYDRAIALAKEHDYLNEEALANELAAAFHLQIGQSRLGQLYLQDAHYCYERWGAIAKVKDLETRYASFLDPSKRSGPIAQEGRLTRSLTTTGSTETSAFDLAALMQAAQVLSGEIVLERLLAKLMKILIENAGAQKGCLLLETGGQFCIEAQGSVNQEDVTVLQSLPVAGSNTIGRVSSATIDYVSRTRESLVLQDATQDNRFARDPYIVQQRPKSVLCAPLLNQGKLTGIVYLENNLTTDAFTSDRLEVIQLLSTQAAISIDNARLYDDLELRVQARTTELTQANQQLEQLTAELQRSNQELEQFAYVASHDLQEPLRAITSYTQRLAQRYQGQLDEKADRYIEFAVDGATRMQQLIQDLLTYSRVGRQKLKLEPIDCNTIVHKVQRDLKVAIAESQATLSINPLPTLYADSTQIALLFQNLIGNAIKYRSEEPPQVQVSVVREGDDWRFRICDNGIGIEPEYCDRIFTIFQRLHTSDEYPGTGLGLAICQKIVQNHGGRIWVESQLGQGSAFCFDIPDLEQHP